MSLPRTCQSPTTLLQSVLFDLGFTHWWVFPASDFPHRSGFYAALATGLMCHMWPRYEEFWKLQSEGNWHMAVAALKKIDEKYGRQYGEEKFQQIGYWQEIGDECNRICADLFIKPDFQATIRQKQVRETNESAFYQRIAQRFMTYLCIYEVTEDGTPTFKEFHSDTQGEFATFVNIAFENDSVLVLSHRDFEWGTLQKQKFPNYKKIRVPGAEPIGLNGPPASPKPTDFQLTAVIHTFTKLANSLGRFAVEVRGNLPSAKTSQEEIREVLQELKELCGKDLHLEDAERVLTLQIEPLVPVKPRALHTILNCEDYQEEGPTAIHHTHRFHTKCLYEYLNSVTEDFSSGLKCPFDTCQTPLAENVLDEFPDLKEKYVEWKTQTMKLSSDSALSAAQQPCHSCRQVDFTAGFSCGCRLCRPCSSNSYYYGAACVKCRNAFSEQDKTEVSLLFSRFPMS